MQGYEDNLCLMEMGSLSSYSKSDENAMVYFSNHAPYALCLPLHNNYSEFSILIEK